jgi:hypothetical protein
MIISVIGLLFLLCLLLTLVYVGLRKTRAEDVAEARQTYLEKDVVECFTAATKDKKLKWKVLNKRRYKNSESKYLGQDETIGINLHLHHRGKNSIYLWIYQAWDSNTYYGNKVGRMISTPQKELRKLLDEVIPRLDEPDTPDYEESDLERLYNVYCQETKTS